jgi:large subunit ribosomal protein L35
VKAKPKKALKKRFKVTGTGKLVHNRPGKRHILTKKSSDRKRKLSKDAVLDETLTKKYAQLMIGA